MEGLRKGSSELTSLVLSDNSFGGEGVEILAEIVGKQKRLEHLIISDANLGAKGVAQIVKTLKTTLPPLQVCPPLPAKIPRRSRHKVPSRRKWR